jgi:hypothetical protein
MTESELERLERDVEQSRKRLTEDLALLRRPSALSEFKQDLISRAFRTKDDLVHQTTSAALTGAQQFLADIKSRAAANPAAVFAIAAGLAWRLARHPPISTILVGLGIAGLLKTDPTSRPSPVTVRATELANSASDLRVKWPKRHNSGACRRGARRPKRSSNFTPLPAQARPRRAKQDGRH